MKKVIPFVCGALVFGCSGGTDDTKTMPDGEVVVPRDEDVKPFEHDASGSWILTEFHDSIVVHRRIGRFRMPIPVWTALVLRVDSDTVRCNGTLLPWPKKFQRMGKDTLLVMDSYGPQTFIHDPIADVVRVIWQNSGVPERHGVHHYRRLRPDELHLLEGIDAVDPSRTWHFKHNYHAYLTRFLFEGRYEPLDGDQHAFRIDAEGAISGHPEWTEFYFHDYFGTRHPFRNDLDGLIFRDTTKRWPHSTFGFSWSFSGDTLVLRPMTTDGDFFYPAEGEHKYLKRP